MLGLAACGGGGGSGGSSSGGGGGATPANQAGSVAIAGTPTQNQVLTATVSDGNGVPSTIAYQWMANGNAIPGATARTYGLTQAEVGKTITVKATYTDGNGYAEAPVSTATAAVADANDAPTLSFTASGVALLGLPGRSNAMGIRRLSSGQIMVSGRIDAGMLATSDFMLERRNADGSIDTSFGNNGVVTTDFANQYDYGAGTPAIQTDGKILLGGAATMNVVDGTDFALARYNVDGSLDTTFGQRGKVVIDFQHGDDRINKVLLQPDGKIIAAGGAYDAARGQMEMAMVRLLPNGSLDASFGAGGKLTSIFTAVGGGGEIEDAQLMADGRIVVAGELGRASFLARLMPTGVVDPAFKNGSYADTYMSISYRLALAVDGSIYVIGNHAPNASIDWAVAKYKVDGYPDNSFGTYNGETQIDFSGKTDVPMDIAILNDGSLLIAGYADSTPAQGRYNAALAKLKPTGYLDQSFGIGGRVAYDLSGSSDVVYGMDITPDGRILLAGELYNQNSDGYEATIGRLLPNGDPDPAFGQTMGRYLQGQSPGVIVGGIHAADVDVPTGGNYNGYVVKLKRAGGGWASDAFSGSGGVILGGGTMFLNGNGVGAYSASQGVLTLTFNAMATPGVLDQVLSSLAFSSSDIHWGGRLALDWTFTDPQGASASAQTTFYIGDDYGDKLDKQLITTKLSTMYSPWPMGTSVNYAGRWITTATSLSMQITGNSTALGDSNRTVTTTTITGNTVTVYMLTLGEAQSRCADTARAAAYASGDFWTATSVAWGQHAVINMATCAVRSVADGAETHPALFLVQ